MQALINAIRFLTIVRIPERIAPFASEPSAYAKSIPFFPVVGLLIGGIAAAAAWFTGLAAGPLVVAVVGCLMLAAVTGGLHLDGLADTADGFLSHAPREKLLEIMRDSRLGAMGGMAIAFVLLLKVALLADLSSERQLVALLMSPVAGRCMIVLMLTLLRYARPGGGLGTAFCDFSKGIVLTWSMLFLVVLAVVLAGWGGAAGAVLGVLGVVGCAISCPKKIGGMTGDTLGAASEIAEILFILGMVIVR